jgi:hypothetical protein
MSVLTMNVIFQDIKKLETEALIVGFFEDVRPLKGVAGELDWLLCGALSRLVLGKRMRGSLGEVALLTSRGKVPAQKVFMVGLGQRADFSLQHLRDAARTAAASAVGAGVRAAAIECFQPLDAPSGNGVSALREGLSQGAGARALDVTVLAPDAAAYEKLSRFVKGQP